MVQTTTLPTASTSAATGTDNEVTLEIHPLPSDEGVLVRVIPPQAPTDTSIDHVPCNIVLVIDCSGSMGTEAQVPRAADDSSAPELSPFSVLDLAKHAGLTILETLDERDRLGIVTFSTLTKVALPLLPMNEENKTKARKAIQSMQPEDLTNMWSGLLQGIDLFKDVERSGNVPALMLLTDGLPNHMNPAEGFVPKLRSLKAPHMPAIHTFGFGFSLRSGLLASIADSQGGNYSFISDPGMIATVFVNAVANLQSTFADVSNLRLQSPAGLELHETFGDRAGRLDAKVIQDESDGTSKNELNVALGSLQYGQSRDIFFACSNPQGLVTGTVEASLTYSKMTSQSNQISSSSPLTVKTDLSEAVAAYHVSRSRICATLSAFFPLRWDGERQGMSFSPVLSTMILGLIAALPAAQFKDAQNLSLLQDLIGRDYQGDSSAKPEPKGEIAMAVSSQQDWSRWGVHYLPSLMNAHYKQVCNSFKDAGPLQYGVDSPLFVRCRDRLNDAFDHLPPLQGSLTDRIHRPSHSTPGISTPASSAVGNFDMSSYNRPENPCFAGFCRVQLASGRSVRVCRLQRGMEVRTPLGSRKVAAVLKTRVRQEAMVRVGSLIVTPWHPVRNPGSNSPWVFPVAVAEEKVRYTGSIYSVLLQRDEQVDAHAIMVGGQWGVTLGHGLLHECGDARAHEFLGDYSKVMASLARLPGRRDGVVYGGGVVRDSSTDLICGFLRPSLPARRRTMEDLAIAKIVC